MARWSVSNALLLIGIFPYLNVASAGAVAQQSGMHDWNHVQAIVGRIHGVSSSPPKGIVSTKYTSGALLGNGDIGVVAGDTATDRQRFWFAKSDFWGTHWNAKHHAPEVSILSLGSLTIGSSLSASGTGSAYRVDQDILRAEVETTLVLGASTVHLRSWTADGENVFVTEMWADPAASSPVPVDLTLAMPAPDPSGHSTYPALTGSRNGVLWASRANDLSGANDYQARAAIAVRAIGATLRASAQDRNTVVGSFRLIPRVHVWIVAAFKSDARIGGDGPSGNELVRGAVLDATRLSAPRVAAMQAAHREWWRRFWSRSLVDLHDPILENFYYGSLYVLGSSSRPGKLAPSLWGNFVTTDDAAWGGRYFMNYNEEAPYYGVFSSNHPDLADPYNRMVLAQIPAQQNRTALAGYKGVAFQRTFSPITTMARPQEPAAVAPEKDWHKLPSDQKSNATFSILPLMQYWEYTQDQKFLRTALYPAMKDLDAFWRDFAVRDASGKRWVFEHTSAHEGGDDVDPNLDIGFARRVANELIETSKLLGVDAGMRPVWRRFLDDLSDYPTEQVDGKTVYTIAGSIKNSIKDQGLFEPGDQPINLEGLVFPGENLAIRGDARQLSIARDSMEEMNSWGVTKGGNSHNGFCKIFPIAARIGWPADDLIEKLKAAILYQWRPSNLTVYQGGGGIETSGTIEAIDSMLLQHESGVLRVFPDWPASRDAEFTHLRAKGAFVVSSEQRQGRVQWIEIESEKGGVLTIASPWGRGKVYCTGCGHMVAPDAAGNIYLRTVPRGEYRLVP